MKEFKNKIVIISGGSRGIGRACVKGFYKEGARVIFTYNKNKSLAEELIREIKEKNRELIAEKLDVGDLEECKNLIAKVLRKFRRIDILINNAGITKNKSLMMMQENEWREVLKINLDGLFNMTKASVVTFMKQRSGCIINISSVSGLIGLPGQSNYSASKAGIIGFSKALSKELAPYNIRVNVVAPGFIDTDMTKDILPRFREEMLKLIPLRRFGNPQEVAEAVLFLASSRASYITGEVIKIDGGLAI